SCSPCTCTARESIPNAAVRSTATPTLRHVPRSHRGHRRRARHTPRHLPRRAEPPHTTPPARPRAAAPPAPTTAGPTPPAPHQPATPPGPAAAPPDQPGSPPATSPAEQRRHIRRHQPDHGQQHRCQPPPPVRDPLLLTSGDPLLGRVDLGFQLGDLIGDLLVLDLVHLDAHGPVQPLRDLPAQVGLPRLDTGQGAGDLPRRHVIGHARSPLLLRRRLLRPLHHRPRFSDQHASIN